MKFVKQSTICLSTFGIAILAQALLSFGQPVDCQQYTMLSLYQKSEQFVLNTMKIIGKESCINKTVRARMEHFKSVLTSLPQDIDDSDAAMVAMQQHSDAFSESARQEFAEAIIAHMSSGTPVAGDNASDGSKLQVLQCIVDPPKSDGAKSKN